MYLKPQNVQSWRFCSTVKGVEPKNMTGDNVLCKKWYLLGFLGAASGVFTAAMASLCMVNGVTRESFLCLYLTPPRFLFSWPITAICLHSSENKSFD